MNVTLLPQPTYEVVLPADLHPDCRVKATGPEDLSSGPRQATSNGGSVSDSESDFGALVYIVVVLIFYSTGVMVMIVRYLKTEKKELEEEATLENFFRMMPDPKQEQEHRVNQVAIRAFHTLTSISYDDDELEELDILSVCGDRPQPLIEVVDSDC